MLSAVDHPCGEDDADALQGQVIEMLFAFWKLSAGGFGAHLVRMHRLQQGQPCDDIVLLQGALAAAGDGVARDLLHRQILDAVEQGLAGCAVRQLLQMVHPVFDRDLADSDPISPAVAGPPVHVDAYLGQHQTVQYSFVLFKFHGNLLKEKRCFTACGTRVKHLLYLYFIMFKKSV
ncbi:MAG: hypothetical protein ACLVJ6_12795 [Merdibacter sp.]